jgi:hypothetical protein
MNYQEQLSPWVVYQVVSDSERQLVQRYRRRNNADAYVKLMAQTQPHISFVVAFDAGSFIKTKVAAVAATETPSLAV